jgi:hydrogenase expression/formation protein HypE
MSESCPIPKTDYPAILLAHGGGGMLTRQLIDKLFLPAFDNPQLGRRHDGAILEAGGARLAFTTDGYVVRPLFFPGGDIGTLAVNGTVNDLAMCGARPLWLSVAFIVEEGLPMETLARVVGSMRDAARAAGVALVTGDTKVVERGKADGLYVTTAGVGVIEAEGEIGPASIRPGDAILLSGDIGRHGIAIMASREGLQFDTAIESDCAPLNALVLKLLEAKVAVRCLRDLTRGGLAAALIEIALDSRIDARLEERAIPVGEAVRGACELLGLDPLHVANEGRMIAVVDPADAGRALAILRDHPAAPDPSLIGRFGDRGAGQLTMTSAIGATRILTMPSGEQLPRIC